MLKQPFPIGIVQVYDAPSAIGSCKEPGLGPKIVLQVFVVIQVVTGQVCKEGHLEPAAFHPALVEGMGGDLGYHVPCTRIQGLLQKAVKGYAIWCGEAGGSFPVTNPLAYGP